VQISLLNVLNSEKKESEHINIMEKFVPAPPTGLYSHVATLINKPSNKQPR